MDLDEAISAHVRWKVHLLQCLHGQVEPPDAAQIARDDACPLGIWLVGEGKQHAPHAACHETTTAHTQFHLRAADVVSALRAGHREQARSMLEAGSAFTKASDDVVLALTRLRVSIRRAG